MADNLKKGSGGPLEGTITVGDEVVGALIGTALAGAELGATLIGALELGPVVGEACGDFKSIEYINFMG